jgi:hypothetical protein
MQQSIQEGKPVEEDESTIKEDDPEVKDMFSAKHSGMSKHGKDEK